MDLQTANLDPHDRQIVQEFAEMLRQVKDAKTRKERAMILLEADAKARATGPPLRAACPGYNGKGTAPPCCERAGEYNGYGSDGPTTFTCPKHCGCHD